MTGMVHEQGAARTFTSMGAMGAEIDIPSPLQTVIDAAGINGAATWSG